MKKNLESIQDIIANELQRNPQLNSPRIIAVSKKQPIEKIRQLYDLGVRDFAENYMQEALEKKKSLRLLEIRWHFIGNIQAKKIKNMVGEFDLIHSVSRLSEVKKISEVALERGFIQKILLQVNIASEESKQGFDPTELLASLPVIASYQGVTLCGLMVFPPLSELEEESLQWFQKAHDLFKSCQDAVGQSFSRLSMGTSHDFHLALRKGATDLRIGENLLGPRPLKSL